LPSFPGPEAGARDINNISDNNDNINNLKLNVYNQYFNSNSSNKYNPGDKYNLDRYSVAYLVMHTKIKEIRTQLLQHQEKKTCQRFFA
jgi:hypothetical protein